MRYLAGLVLVAHACVHLAIWLPAYDPDKREYDARHSWIGSREQLDPVVIERTAIWGAVLCAALFTLSGALFITGLGGADEIAVGAAVLSMLLGILYLNPWLISFLVVDLAILVLAL
jgi:hypothetical protein